MRRSPSISIATYHAAPRLACVKPVASVHPEPGSNSSLLKLFYIFAQNLVFIVVTDGMFRISIRLLYYLLICNIFKELIAIVSIAAAKVRSFFKLTNFLEENLKSFFSKPSGWSDISLSLANLILPYHRYLLRIMSITATLARMRVQK